MKKNERVTIKHVANEAKVSIASVSLFLNDKPGLAESTRQRIAVAIEKLEYIKRNQVSNNANIIGLLVESLPFSLFSDLHYGEVLHSIEAQTKKLGYHLSLIVIEPDEPLDNIIKRIGDTTGIIILGAGVITEVVINRVLNAGNPAILVDVNLPGIEVNSVLVDNSGGAQQLISHLINQGYKHIACIQGPEKYPSLVERFQGYCNALTEAGMPLNPNLIQASISKGYPNKGYREMKALLECGHPLDAVFCVSDRAALGALQALNEANLEIPNDIALVGFEDVPQTSHTIPPLTTVKMPKSLMGKLAVRRLDDIIHNRSIEEPYKSVLFTSLVLRQSA